MSDLIVRGLLKSMQARFVACSLSETAQVVCDRHKLQGPAARLMSEALTGCALLGSILKGNEKVTLQLRTEGKLRSLLADIDHDGNVRGTMRAEPGATYRELVDANGVLILSQSHLGKMVYQGTSQMLMANLPGDLALHCSTSQQIETYMGVIWEAPERGDMLAAGLLLQALPDVDIEAFDAFRRKLETGQQQISRELAIEPRAYALHLLRDFEPHVLLEKPLQHHCTCSKERIEPILLAMGADEIHSLIEEQDGASVVCQWCGKGYEFSADELRALLEQAAQQE